MPNTTKGTKSDIADMRCRIQHLRASKGGRKVVQCRRKNYELYSDPSALQPQNALMRSDFTIHDPMTAPPTDYL